MSPLQPFYNAITEVSVWWKQVFVGIFSALIPTDNQLFRGIIYSVFTFSIMGFAVDLIFTFMLSVKFKKLVFFNPLKVREYFTKSSNNVARLRIMDFDPVFYRNYTTLISRNLTTSVKSQNTKLLKSDIRSRLYYPLKSSFFYPHSPKFFRVPERKPVSFYYPISDKKFVSVSDKKFLSLSDRKFISLDNKKLVPDGTKHFNSLSLKDFGSKNIKFISFLNPRFMRFYFTQRNNLKPLYNQYRFTLDSRRVPLHFSHFVPRHYKLDFWIFTMINFKSISKFNAYNKARENQRDAFTKQWSGSSKK